MWEKPRQLLDFCAEACWNLFSESRFWERQYPKYEWSFPEFTRGYSFFELTSNAIKQTFLTTSQTGVMTNEFRKTFNDLLVKECTRIEDSKDFSFLVALGRVSNALGTSDRDYALLAQLILQAMKALLGSPSKTLVGVRGGKPAYKSFGRTLTGEKAFIAANAYNPDLLSYYDQTDMAIVPDPMDALSTISRKFVWPRIDIAEVRELLEDAYYNQRYIVNPEGAYVKLRHFGPFKGLTLKVKSPGIHDPNYIDFLCVIDIDLTELDSQQYGQSHLIKKKVYVVDGATAQGIMPYGVVSDDNYFLYLMWTVAFVYHDLVTAKEISIPGNESVVSERNAQFSEVPSEKPSWIYIPRLIKNRNSPPRLPTEPRELKPHHVRGHLRRKNLTEQHRKELGKFERETGLKVLDILDRNPGFTFVRPYVVPSMEDVRGLPKFIHARLQSEIDQMLSMKQIEKVRVELSSEIK